MTPARCSAPAASVTEARRTPRVAANDSWVTGNVSRPTRSLLIISQRAQRSSTVCNLLHPAVRPSWLIRASVYRCKLRLQQDTTGDRMPEADRAHADGLTRNLHHHFLVWRRIAQKNGQPDQPLVAGRCALPGRTILHWRE